MAFLVVLESMTPAERVAFILHDVFRYSFAEVAEIVGRTPAACRQLASSARRRIHTSQAPAAPTVQQAGIVRDFRLNSYPQTPNWQSAGALSAGPAEPVSHVSAAWLHEPGTTKPISGIRGVTVHE